jgi:glycosyltransferase involved in cell wall biosynthesis
MNVASQPIAAMWPAEEGRTDPSEPEVILDLSRLLSRVLHATPTGVDRVEMAYARALMKAIPERLSFGAVHPSGVYGRLPLRAVTAFLDRTEALWHGQQAAPRTRMQIWADAAAACIALRPRRIRARRERRVLLQASPHHLHDERHTAKILRREGAKFVCLLHDLIPIEYPEYARPNGTALHLRRIRTVAGLADAVITNSEATRQAFLPYLQAERRDIPVQVAHLGIDLGPHLVSPQITGERPYFVCLGTIEPRKNHLLLLNIWRRLLSEAGETAPRLILIGRRGWENENIIDMLDRCPVLRHGVEEYSGLPDQEVRRLLAGARALLMPSFAEGYGLPVAEALDLRVPVICSDLPALREVGGDVPEYLDPLDGPRWAEAIGAYAREDSARREAQLARMVRWKAASWSDHIGVILELPVFGMQLMETRC